MSFSFFKLQRPQNHHLQAWAGTSLHLDLIHAVLPEAVSEPVQILLGPAASPFTFNGPLRENPTSLPPPSPAATASGRTPLLPTERGTSWPHPLSPLHLPSDAPGATGCSSGHSWLRMEWQLPGSTSVMPWAPTITEQRRTGKGSNQKIQQPRQT